MKKPMKRERPNALIIRPKEKEQYADILKRVKRDPSANQMSECIDKIRRTTSGDVLLILSRKDTDKAPQLKKAISELLGQDATVVSKVPEEDVEIKDLEESTTKQEILEALQKVLSSASWLSDQYGHAALWACGRSPLESVDLITKGCVKAKIGGIHFYSCYAAPSRTIQEFNDFLDTIVDDVQSNSPVAIAGDFNAWAIDWGSKTTNARGRELIEAMSAIDVVLLNKGNEPTFSRGEASSIVDLTFVSSVLAKENTSWKTDNNPRSVKNVYTVISGIIRYYYISQAILSTR
ncbi:unnamed protein product [Colias eurytheme]|nr:unnamed protein product [Colias eurytheme]